VIETTLNQHLVEGRLKRQTVKGEITIRIITVTNGQKFPAVTFWYKWTE